MSEKPLRFMKSVENLPTGRRGRDSFYDEIVREFLYSGAKYAEVKDIGKKPIAVLLGIRNRLRKRKDAIQVCIRKGKVYLARVESPQQTQLPSARDKTLAPTISNVNPAFEVITLLDTALVKARCPRCKTLNGKDSRVCSDCRNDLYSTEQEYQNSLREMDSLEKTLNSGR